MLSRARAGDFIKDKSPMKRSLGLVMAVDEETGLMCVRFPKAGRDHWIVWENNGQYRVINHHGATYSPNTKELLTK
jgi:hypothetical protein|tara:strand:- start:109 stop:336 length:228 start_codon:yes stop_codon:yes gene_type:complete